MEKTALTIECVENEDQEIEIIDHNAEDELQLGFLEHLIMSKDEFRYEEILPKVPYRLAVYGEYSWAEPSPGYSARGFEITGVDFEGINRSELISSRAEEIQIEKYEDLDTKIVEDILEQGYFLAVGVMKFMLE